MKRSTASSTGIFLSLLVLSFSPGARAQTTTLPSLPKVGPDLLQTVGVGSRSIAMGNAFSAIADDASATFWNPGRLGYLINDREVMIDYRSVLVANENINTNTVGTHPGHLQLGFGSVIFPIGNSGKNGVLGLSYTLGGYYSLNAFQQHSPSGQSPSSSNTAVTLVRNTYTTVAYGKTFNLGHKVANKRQAEIGVGLGVYFLNQDISQANTTTLNSGPNASTTTSFAKDTGHGTGVNIGLAFTPPGKSPWLFGFDYRSGTHINGLSLGVGQTFNNEMPDRFSLGAALTSRNFVFSNEVQLFTSANLEKTGPNNVYRYTDARRPVTNYHMGLEYTPRSRGAYKIPIRFGFQTNANAAFQYTKYDNIVSMGFALQRFRQDRMLYSFEPAVEFLTSNGAVQYSLTGRLTF